MLKKKKNEYFGWDFLTEWNKNAGQVTNVGLLWSFHEPCYVLPLLHAQQNTVYYLGKLDHWQAFMKDRFTIQTHPQWNFADFGCTDLRVSPVHLTWYQSSQSSHCTQSTSLSWLWGWRQSTDEHVLYMKLSLSAESLLLKDFRAAFLQVKVCFRRLLLAVEVKGGYQIIGIAFATQNVVHA